ncbi:MAG TPA: Gfo/Idh/MocA family oxidoreductase [Clostridiaceae bacterium]
MKNFKAGVVGTGFIGVAHVEALRRIGNIEVVAISDSFNAEEKAKVMNIPHWFHDYKDMISKMELDVIHVCTPNNTHYEISKYAMERGINVVCEKPVTTTVKEAEELLKIAKEKKLIHAVNFHNRFNPMVYELKKMIQDNSLGEIFSIHGAYLQDWLLYDTDYNWRIKSKESGSTRVVADLGSHWMDTVENITGLRITEVFAEFTIYHKIRKRLLKPSNFIPEESLKPEDYEEIHIDTEDAAFIIFRFSNGAKGNLALSQMFAGRKNKLSIFVAGTKESAEWDSENINGLYLGRRNNYNQIVVKDTNLLHKATADIVSYPGGHVEGFPDTIKQNFIKIYKSLEDKSMDREYATFEDGARSMKLCEKIFESAQTSKWVNVMK